MQRYFSYKREDSKLFIEATDSYHIYTVMRMKTGDLVEVVFENKLFLCEVNVNEKVSVSIKEELQISKSKAPLVSLILPFLKEQKLDLILQKATELGVCEFIFIDMERSIIRLNEAQYLKKVDRWTKICKEASEQSKRIVIPKISYFKNTKDLQNLEGLKLVCSLSDDAVSIKNFLTTNTNCDRISLVIGPEGGISPNEESKLISLGYNKASLGTTVLRAETAPICALSIINYEYME